MTSIRVQPILFRTINAMSGWQPEGSGMIVRQLTHLAVHNHGTQCAHRSRNYKWRVNGVLADMRRVLKYWSRAVSQMTQVLHHPATTYTLAPQTACCTTHNDSSWIRSYTEAQLTVLNRMGCTNTGDRTWFTWREVYCNCVLCTGDLYVFCHM